MIKTYKMSDGKNHDRFRALGGFFNNKSIAMTDDDMASYPLNTKIIPDARTTIDITFWIIPGLKGDKTFSAARYIFGSKNIKGDSDSGSLYLYKKSTNFELHCAGKIYSFSDTQIKTTGSRFRFTLEDDSVTFSNLTSGYSRGSIVDTTPFGTTPAIRPIVLFGFNRGGTITDGTNTASGGIVAIEECKISGYDSEGNFLDYHFIPASSYNKGYELGPIYYGFYDVNNITHVGAFHNADLQGNSSGHFIVTTAGTRGTLPPDPETEKSFKSNRRLGEINVYGLPNEKYATKDVILQDVDFTFTSIPEMKKGTYQPYIVVEAIPVPGYVFDHFEIHERYFSEKTDSQATINDTLIIDRNNPAAIRLRTVESGNDIIEIEPYINVYYKPAISEIHDFGKCFIKPGSVTENGIELKCELEVVSAEINEDMLQQTSSTILVKDLPNTVVPGDIVLLYSSSKRVYQGVIKTIVTGDETSLFNNRYLNDQINLFTLECREMQSIFDVDFLFHATGSIPDGIDSTTNLNMSHTIIQKAIDSIYFERLAAGQLSDNWKSGSKESDRSGYKAYDLATFNKFKAFNNGYFVLTHNEEYIYTVDLKTGEETYTMERPELVWTNLYSSNLPGENPMYEAGGLLSPQNVDKHDSAEVKNFEDFIFTYSGRDNIYVKFDIRPDSSMDGHPYRCYTYRPNLNTLHLNSFDEDIQNVTVNDDDFDECSVLVCYDSTGKTIRAVYAKQKVVISTEPLKYADQDRIVMIMKNGKRLVGTNKLYDYIPSDKYGVKIEVSDDALKTLKNKNMSETDENCEITLNIIFDSGRYRLDDLVLGRDANLYFRDKVYRSVLTAYKFSIDTDGIIHSAEVTLGKARSSLTGKINLGRLNSSVTYATE